MTDTQKHDHPDEPDLKKTPLNLNELAANPMRVGMARLGKGKQPQSKQPKKHWWSRKTK
ncbi:hypothetical protein [Secundilactobacillus pentosiphilus]|uniref:hypothetical protein n=1 Tax=Secundilactobacillus pentosiphilus TaxID=1714682 RepID=UPI0015C5AF2B|nr:hypothetical protein [Secundilactobacillus pentosiphilus]